MDERAFTRVAEEYAGRLYAVAYRLLRNRADAEDAVQRALMKAFAARASYSPRWAVSTWLYRVLSNVCIDELRRRRPYPEPAGGHAAPAGLVRRLVPRLTDGPPGLEALANRFRIEATDRGVARLLLGRGVAAVSPRARRHAAQALEELREYLADRRAFFAVDVDLADVAPFQ